MSEPTRGRILSTRTRGGRALAEVELADGDTRTRVELLMPYGASALPEQGADVLIFEVGGNRDHLVALMADATGLRIPGLQPGEVGLRDKRGQQVVLRSDCVEIVSALEVRIMAPGAGVKVTGNVAIEGKLTVTETIVATGNVTGAGVGLATHRHNETDSVTSTPIA